MRSKRSKGYWQKRKESYTQSEVARSRARLLRTHEHIEHVKVEQAQQEYTVHYSIAKWYEEQLQQAHIQL